MKTEEICENINGFIQEVSKIRSMSDESLVKLALVINSENVADLQIGEEFSGIKLSVFDFIIYELDRRNINTTNAMYESRSFFSNYEINSVSKFEELSDEDACNFFIRMTCLLMDIRLGTKDF